MTYVLARSPAEPRKRYLELPYLLLFLSQQVVAMEHCHGLQQDERVSPTVSLYEMRNTYCNDQPNCFQKALVG